jgi:hypothetical protein
MATPPDPQTQFDTDWANMMSAASEYQAAVTAEEQSKAEYQSMLVKLKACTTVDQIMVYLEYYLFQNSNSQSDGCAFGMFNDDISVQGKALKVNSYLTAVHNDMQNIINDDNYSNDPQQVLNVANDLDKMLNTLDTNPLFNPKLGGGACLFDQSTWQQLRTNDVNLRNEFYIQGDASGYNPPVNTPPQDPNEPYTYTYHFTYGVPESSYLCSTFEEMQERMQAPGDQSQATEAYKNLTNNLNADTTLTQTVNSALNQKINNLTNFIKVLMGFYENGILQPQTKMINAAIQNTGKS